MPLVPDPKNCDISVKRAIQGLSEKLGYTGNPTFANITLTDLTASALIGTNASKLLESVTIGTGLDYTRPTISLSHLGIEALTDPGADRVFFWDNSASASKWLAVGNSIVITATTVDTVQDIRTSASPTFAGLGVVGNIAVTGIAGDDVYIYNNAGSGIRIRSDSVTTQWWAQDDGPAHFGTISNDDLHIRTYNNNRPGRRSPANPGDGGRLGGAGLRACGQAARPAPGAAGVAEARAGGRARPAGGVLR